MSGGMYGGIGSGVRYPTHTTFALAPIIVIATIVFAISCITGCNESYSDGFRVGVIVKVSNKGMIWKSWEAEMMTGGSEPATGSGVPAGAVIPAIFAFSTRDPAIAEALEAAANGGHRVKIVYRQWFIGPCTVSTKYIAEKVEQ